MGPLPPCVCTPWTHEWCEHLFSGITYSNLPFDIRASSFVPSGPSSAGARERAVILHYHTARTNKTLRGMWRRPKKRGTVQYGFHCRDHYISLWERSHFKYPPPSRRSRFIPYAHCCSSTLRRCISKPGCLHAQNLPSTALVLL